MFWFSSLFPFPKQQTPSITLSFSYIYHLSFCSSLILRLYEESNLSPLKDRCPAAAPTLSFISYPTLLSQLQVIVLTLSFPSSCLMHSVWLPPSMTIFSRLAQSSHMLDPTDFFISYLIWLFVALDSVVHLLLLKFSPRYSWFSPRYSSFSLRYSSRLPKVTFLY